MSNNHPKLRQIHFERPGPLLLRLSRDYIHIQAAEQEYGGLVARQPIRPEMT